MNEEWEDTKYTCDCCGEDGYGKFYFISLRGHFIPICVCERCAEEMAVYNE